MTDNRQTGDAFTGASGQGGASADRPAVPPEREIRPLTNRPADRTLWIGGRWHESRGGKPAAARSPATGDQIGMWVQGTRDDARAAIEAARKACDTYRWMPLWRRAELCLRIAEAIRRRRTELAFAVALEQGKPFYSEALGEIDYAAIMFTGAAEQVRCFESPVYPVADSTKLVLAIRQPRGVYAVIAPTNYPVNIACEYIAPALATGNTCVWVPSPTTTLCSVRLAEVFDEAGVPPGVINLVTGLGAEVGDEVVGHPGTDAVGFTGSPRTGRLIAQRAAGKPLLLELGGNGPTIVLDDVNVAQTARLIAWNSFSNAGQICSATERLLAVPAIAPDLADALVDAAKTYKMGDPLDPDCNLGPVNTREIAQKTQRHVDDAVQHGAKVLCGGRRPADMPTDLFYPPTVLANVTPDTMIQQEETFGPVAPVFTVPEEQLVPIANACPLGLAAAVFGKDVGRAYRIAEQLRAGLVAINDHSSYWEGQLPFGGASGTGSGLGRLGGKHVIMEMTDVKTIAINMGPPVQTTRP